MFDRCEDCIPNFYNLVSEDVGFFIGSEHPFGNMLSATSFKFGNSLLILLTPMRTDYKRNYSILQTVKEILNK